MRFEWTTPGVKHSLYVPEGHWLAGDWAQVLREVQQAAPISWRCSEQYLTMWEIDWQRTAAIVERLEAERLKA